MSIIPSHEPKALAIRRLNQAAFLAAVGGVLSVVSGLVKVSWPNRSESAVVAATFICLQAPLAFLMAYGMYRRSRIAALAYLTLSLPGAIVVLLGVAPAGAGLSAMIFVAVVLTVGIRAVVGAFSCHSLMKKPLESPSSP